MPAIDRVRIVRETRLEAGIRRGVGGFVGGLAYSQTAAWAWRGHVQPPAAASWRR
jgi:hypothetical protein